MNAKYLALLMIFGLFATLVQCRSFVERDDDSDDDSDGDNAVDTRATDDSDGSDDVDNNELRGKQSFDCFIFGLIFLIIRRKTWYR